MVQDSQDPIENLEPKNKTAGALAYNCLESVVGIHQQAGIVKVDACAVHMCPDCPGTSQCTERE